MIEKYLPYIVILFLCIILAFVWNNNQNNMKKFENYENTIKALNDTIQINFDGINKTFSKTSPEIDLKDLLNSETFKSLSDDQKAFYSELKRIRGLISATNAHLIKQDSILQTLYNNPGIISDDSIKFKLGTLLSFKEKDSLKKLQWNANIKLDKDIDFKLNYKYDLKILTTFERQKINLLLLNIKLMIQI
jgi:hypothetical protein